MACWYIPTAVAYCYIIGVVVQHVVILVCNVGIKANTCYRSYPCIHRYLTFYDFTFYQNKHVFICSVLKHVLHRADRAMIYLFIASSYTPWLLLKPIPLQSWTIHLRLELRPTPLQSCTIHLRLG